MAERYSRLFTLPENLYTEGSPVIIAAGALLKDNQTGKVLAQLKLRSITEKDIQAVEVRLNLFDTAGSPIGEPVMFDYLDLRAIRDTDFGQKTPVMVPESKARSYTAAVTEVVFSDKSTWTADGVEWEPLPRQKTLEGVFQDSELVKQYKIAVETQYIYAPLAHRLGLFPIKSELENLSFKYEHPDTYAELEKKLEKVKGAQMEMFEQFAQPIRNKLTMMGYDFELHGRIKSIYSIWKKMSAKQVPFEEVYDLLAVRIIFTPKLDMSEKDQCWMIYSALTEMYKPHPERIRDWISTPKANGYEALHVTVMGPEGLWIEVQIRTRRMHEIAEKGLAAHWKYKTGFNEEETELDKWIRTIREMLQNPSPNAVDFMDTFKLNLFAEEVFVFTPKGDIRTLPQGATVIDFAYLLHSELGDHCIGAKVNHKLQPLSYQLRGGDQVEILTSHTSHPAMQWLDWTETARAKERIKKYLRKQGVLSEQALQASEQVMDEQAEEKTKKIKSVVLTDDNINVLYKLEPCCHPIPGDEVLGYRDLKGQIQIHRVECPIAARHKSQHGKNLLSATWDITGANTYKQTIRIEGIDKVGLLIQVLYTISENYHVNMTDMQFSAKDGVVTGTITLNVHSLAEVNKIFRGLYNIKEIKALTRV